MLAGGLTLLSPQAAAIGIPALGAVVATVFGQRRADAVRQGLQLPPPGPRRARTRLALVAAVVALLSLSAAQPALTRDHHQRVRRDVQVLFVLDVSRSMAASAGSRSPTRLDRAVAAAVRLRLGVASVPAGVATLTDRVLPDLLPVLDPVGFDRVARAVSIESPPPQASSLRATSYDALQQIPGAGYFDPKARSRIVVVLTDGESAPVQTGEVVAAFDAHPGYHLLLVRFWHPREQIFDSDGGAETAYRSDPSGGAVLDALASALGGSAYDESGVGDAGRRLNRLAGSGPTTELRGTVRTQTPLAPFTAGLALLATVVLTGLGLRSGVRTRVPWAFF